MDRSQAKLIGLGGTTAAALYLQRKYGSALVNDVRHLRLEIAVKKILTKVFTNNYMFVDLFLESVAKHPYKPCILFHNSIYSYGEVDFESNKAAHFAMSTGCLQQVDTVAFLMKNEPAFCWWFIGMQKIGITCAFMNYNLRGKALLHCINISGSKILICGGEPNLIEALLEILPELNELKIQVWVRGYKTQTLPTEINLIEEHVQSASGSPVPRSCRNQITYDDQSHYIFTSGTTGLPKACKKTYRLACGSSTALEYFRLHQDDVIYTALPLYHSAAFNLSVLNSLRAGCTLAIGRKFSATNFWNDVRKHHATVIHYIGEICRYLLAQPKKPDDGVYPVKVRVAFGNGLRPDIWEDFKQRFNIGQISEFYGATESSHLFVNLDGKVGAVGRISPIMKLRGRKAYVLKCDIETATPIRGNNGKFIIAAPDEVGLLVTVSSQERPFLGYLNKKDTDKKILRNVITEGDTYFNTGDLVKIDGNGHVYFIDRLGDTFRWKGENVATTEVAGILNKFPGIMEANVYGVALPGQDGKAGMAALTLSSGVNALDFKKLYTFLGRSLPSYAQPKFIRITRNMDLTGTYKHKKNEFAKQGFDPNLVPDKLYYLNKEEKTYEILNPETYTSLLKFSSRL